MPAQAKCSHRVKDQKTPGTPKQDRGRLSPKEHPVFFAFGHYHKFLSLDEARKATPEERIASVWPFVIKQARTFIASLHQRELINFDADDILLEIWIELRQKDCKWNPEIGSYCSFAGKIIHHLFVRIRERARTVESPRNTTCRLNEYLHTVQAGGQLSSARLKNWSDINRTIMGIAPMGVFNPAQPDGASPEESCLDGEQAALFADAAKQALCRLDPVASAVLGMLNGLWGSPVRSLTEVARELGKSVQQIRQIRDAASDFVREYLETEFHPMTREYA